MPAIFSAVESSTNNVRGGGPLLLKRWIKRGGGDSQKDNSTVKPCRTLFLRYAKEGKFQELIRVLKSSDNENVIAAWLDDDDSRRRRNFLQDENMMPQDSSSLELDEEDDEEIKRITVLHDILHFHPPVQVVDLLCHALTKIHKISIIPEDMVDATGANPLHVAAATGCDASVIRRLLDGPGEILPAVTLDIRGRTALHWACASHPPCTKSLASINKWIENKQHVIQILLESYPQAKFIRDRNNRMPLDLLFSDPAVGCALNMPRKPQYPASAMAVRNNEHSSESENDSIGSCGDDVRIGYEIIQSSIQDGDDDEDELSLPQL
jgi:hypothetical protein